MLPHNQLAVNGNGIGHCSSILKGGILFPAVLLDFNVLTVLLFYNYFTQNITIRVDVIWLISYGAIYFIPDILL
jgi:hypothetical protein